MSLSEVQRKKQYLEALEQKVKLQEGLPHLYGWKWYPWARAFFESENRNNFLCAANQISKSSTQIRKCIDWATHKEPWAKRWPTTPKQFWYLYPSFLVATAEFKEKWVKEFLPRGEFKDHPVYGWNAVFMNKMIHSIEFNSGVTVYFRSYEQDPKSLQTSSVHAIFADEEMPVHLYDEINVRRSSASVQGHFHMVFTATLGQSLWRETIEEQGTEFEKFKGSAKWQVSMYDCLFYDDMTPSLWTKENIQEVINGCKSEAEVQRRVFGRFVVDEDQKYPGFSKKHCVIPDTHKLPSSWPVYAGVDVGSGGAKGHPAAICFVAVKPDYTEGRVFLGWRGDGVQTTAGDVLFKFQQLRGRMRPVMQFYDWQARDFFTIAQRVGESFMPAEKNHDIGEDILNTLFKNGMLKVYDHPELHKLVNELENLKKSTPKTKAKDDFADALRYAVTKIPWDFQSVTMPRAKRAVKAAQREGRWLVLPPEPDNNGLDHFQAEMDEFNEYLLDVEDDW